MNRVRMWTTIGLLAVVVAAVLFVPLPSHIFCNLEVQARDAAWVYVEVPGTLEEVYVKPGDQVEKGPEAGSAGESRHRRQDRRSDRATRAVQSPAGGAGDDQLSRTGYGGSRSRR